MRPLLAISLVAFILGGLKLYFEFRTRETHAAVALHSAAGVFAVELTTTFPAGPDPFALSGTSEPAVSVRISGSEGTRELLPAAATLAAGQTLAAQVSEAFVQGENALHVRLLRAAGSREAAAVRVRVLQGHRVLADETLWAERGGPVEGEVRFFVPPGEEHSAGETAG